FGPQRCYWGTDMTNGFDRATYKQRITHFTEQLPFLTESDKDWVMGRAILQRLNWTGRAVLSKTKEAAIKPGRGTSRPIERARFTCARDGNASTYGRPP